MAGNPATRSSSSTSWTIPASIYQYTVFAQTLNGLDVVDAMLEGDVIDKIEILP